MESYLRKFHARLDKELGLMEVIVPGLETAVFLRPETSDVPTFQQVFDRGDYDHFEMTMEPAFIVDAGANIGLSAVFLANRFPNATIVALEPEESNFGLLQKNTQRYKGIVPLNAALWWKDTVLDIVNPGMGHWGFQTHKMNHGDSSRVCGSTEAVTVCSIMSAFNIRSVDILKLDVEGAEREILDHSSPWIRSIGLLIVELHERFKEGCEQSFEAAQLHFNSHWVAGENQFLSNGKACASD